VETQQSITEVSQGAVPSTASVQTTLAVVLDAPAADNFASMSSIPPNAEVDIFSKPALLEIIKDEKGSREPAKADDIFGHSTSHKSALKSSEFEFEAKVKSPSADDLRAPVKNEVVTNTMVEDIFASSSAVNVALSTEVDSLGIPFITKSAISADIFGDDDDDDGGSAANRKKKKSNTSSSTTTDIFGSAGIDVKGSGSVEDIFGGF